jgi:hypothetical protein
VTEEEYYLHNSCMTKKDYETELLRLTRQQQ